MYNDPKIITNHIKDEKLNTCIELSMVVPILIKQIVGYIWKKKTLMSNVGPEFLSGKTT